MTISPSVRWKRSSTPPAPARSATARSSLSRSRRRCAFAPASAARTRCEAASGFVRRDRRGLFRRRRFRLAGVKIERHAVHAIALAGRRRPIVENMAQMPAATAAMHLGANHEKAAVARRFDRAVERRREARPAGAAVEFGAGVEQLLTAAGAMIDPGTVLLVERAGSGALGAVLAQDAILLGG